jgi:DNA-directed RNA polymerase subunit RPC12/RpoP
MKTIAYIGAAILIFFGVLFIWGAFGGGAPVVNIIIGVISVLIGFGLIFWASRKKAAEQQQNITLNIDMPGNVSMDTLKCKSCGGTLGPKDVQLVAGAPVVTCPYCNSTYQLTEEPKW